MLPRPLSLLLLPLRPDLSLCPVSLESPATLAHQLNDPDTPRKASITQPPPPPPTPLSSPHTSSLSPAAPSVPENPASGLNQLNKLRVSPLKPYESLADPVEMVHSSEFQLGNENALTIWETDAGDGFRENLVVDTDGVDRPRGGDLTKRCEYVLSIFVRFRSARHGCKCHVDGMTDAEQVDGKPA